MGKSSGGIRKNNVTSKNQNLNRSVNGLAKGVTLKDVLNSLNKDKIALSKMKKRLEQSRKNYDKNDNFFKKTQKDIIEIDELFVKNLETDIKIKTEFLKKNKVKI